MKISPTIAAIGAAAVVGLFVAPKVWQGYADNNVGPLLPEDQKKQDTKEVSVKWGLPIAAGVAAYFLAK